MLKYMLGATRVASSQRLGHGDARLQTADEGDDVSPIALQM